MTNTQQIITHFLLGFSNMAILILFLLFWRQKKKIEKIEADVEELDVLTEQNDEIISELIDDQEAMEEPLQKALVMSQFVIEKLGEMESISFGTLLEKKTAKSN